MESEECGLDDSDGEVKKGRWRGANERLDIAMPMPRIRTCYVCTIQKMSHDGLVQSIVSTLFLASTGGSTR